MQQVQSSIFDNLATTELEEIYFLAAELLYKQYHTSEFVLTGVVWPQVQSRRLSATAQGVERHSGPLHA